MAPVEPREGPQTAKRAQVQADVLRATETLLGEGSTYADLNVERIATAAGISRTAFYFYFRDKRELLMRLAADVSGSLYERADRWFTSGGDTVGEMREALTAIAELYRDHGALLRAIVEVSTYDPEIATYWRGLLGRFVDATAQRIVTEQQAGRAGEMDPAATGFALVWMTERTLYQELVQGSAGSSADAVEALAGIWLRAVYGRVEHLEG
ncbi:TetR/AcrR family transcriptional regulator [Conexibacter sp. SYSU D00693]|uniref:TetR/AcrR family transcriptional regulator n=1 Tax=Conexibacter sp. SYSU D00693 TaxID=2812560 RepID=UPI00196B2A45|nr:TetR/AcrR family transcriptional regulator [Conexibacter sp. SYSU D00693]